MSEERRRSEWGKNLHDLRPYYAERMQLRRVGPLSEPSEPKGFTEYVFDDAQHLLETRTHRGRGRIDVERYHYGDNVIDVELIPSTPGVPITHSRYELAEGRVTAWRWQTAAGPQEETYLYEGDRVTTIRTSGPNDPPQVFRCEWGPTGLLRMTGEREGTGRVVEVFSATPISSPNAISILEELLFQTIVDRVRAFDVHSPAYGLLLVENAGYEATPPELAIGLDCEREAWSAAQLRDRERAWFPENVSLFDRSLSHLDDAGVQSAARQAQQTLRQAADPGGAHRLNVRLAKRLNDESQLLALPKTDDFVVVVVSLEGGLRRAELASYVPRAKLEALRTAGWL